MEPCEMLGRQCVKIKIQRQWQQDTGACMHACTHTTSHTHTHTNGGCLTVGSWCSTACKCGTLHSAEHNRGKLVMPCLCVLLCSEVCGEGETQYYREFLISSGFWPRLMTQIKALWKVNHLTTNCVYLLVRCVRTVSLKTHLVIKVANMQCVSIIQTEYD